MVQEKVLKGFQYFILCKQDIIEGLKESIESQNKKKSITTSEIHC